MQMNAKLQLNLNHLLLPLPFLFFFSFLYFFSFPCLGKRKVEQTLNADAGNQSFSANFEFGLSARNTDIIRDAQLIHDLRRNDLDLILPLSFHRETNAAAVVSSFTGKLSYSDDLKCWEEMFRKNISKCMS